MASGGGLPPPGFPTWDGGGFRAAAPPEFDRSQSTPTLESLQRQLAHSDGNEGGDYAPRRSPFDGSGSNRSYATLGERLGDDDRAAYAWGAPERPQTAPLPEATAERRKTAEQANIQLLISSMQELTAVVARHSDELRRLREDNRAYARRDAALQDSFGAVDHALRDESARALGRAFADNASLFDVNLEYNGFGDAGCEAVAMALEQNSGMRILRLGGARGRRRSDVGSSSDRFTLGPG